MQITRRTEEKENEKKMDTLELQTGEKFERFNGACMEMKIKNILTAMPGKTGNKIVDVLRDSGCNGVTVERELVDEADIIGKVGYMMTVDGMLTRAPYARIEVDMHFIPKPSRLCA